MSFLKKVLEWAEVPLTILGGVALFFGIVGLMQWRQNAEMDGHAEECRGMEGEPYRNGDHVLCLTPGSRVMWRK